MKNGAVVFDTETYPNCFLLGVVDYFNDTKFMFEISEYKDESSLMFEFLEAVRYYKADMIGFNNLNFDYPIIHELWSRPSIASAELAYQKAQAIITAKNRWAHAIWANNRYVRQIDLYKLNHFDNFAKQTSLKGLQFTMRAESIEDLPIEPGTHLTRDQVEITKSYCAHDCDETKRFAHLCKPDIDFRFELAEQFGDEALNWSEIKIGSEFLIRDIGKKNCYYYDANGQRQICQTERDRIDVAEIILPYISFNRPETSALFDEMKSKVIVDTRNSVKTSCEIDGFKFDFGTGGVHGSCKNSKFVSTNERIIVDVDVTSLYPSLIIANKMYPEHLGARFIDRYAATLNQRKKQPKESFLRRLLKYALVGVYGMSNNVWSPFYDPRLTMQVTINGQLSLLMLAEWLLEIEGLTLIQINTDGLTFECDRDNLTCTDKICKSWEALTKLELEHTYYSHFFCRDVNNYIAVKFDSSVKRKGAYEYPEEWSDYNGWWHRNYSALVVPKAVEHELLGRGSLQDFIANHEDAFDFMLRAKCPRTSTLVHSEAKQQRITRYYASLRGEPLVKQSPPVEGAKEGDYKRRNGVDLHTYMKVMREIPPDTWDERIHTKNKSKYGPREIKIHTRCDICNDVKHFDWSKLDREWYVAEALKLVNCFDHD